MKNYVKPEITVKEYRVSKDIAALSEYYYKVNEGDPNEITVSLFVNDSTQHS